jgi:PIN domain nuclease of toxin-antitoxin system
LLDTQALLWFLGANPRLSPVALRHITEPGAELFFSHASVWEITIKYANGKLALPAPPEPFLTEQLTLNRVRLLPISIGSIFHTGQLPAHHKDPFDRLIAAQCLRHNLPLISIDAIFDAYGVRRVW